MEMGRRGEELAVGGGEAQQSLAVDIFRGCLPCCPSGDVDHAVNMQLGQIERLASDEKKPQKHKRGVGGLIK